MRALEQTGLNSRRRNLYPNLETLYIDSCHSLGHVFLPSTAKDLQHLKELFVRNCNMMSWIIGEIERKGVRIDEFVFSELTKLQLNVPTLKGFYFNESVEEHQPYLPPKVSFPRLKILELNVEDFKLDEIEVGINNSAWGITKFVVKCENIVQLPSKWQLQFPNTQQLSLSIQSCEGMEYLACIPRSEIGQSRPLTSFSKLTSLDIYKCSGLKYLFTASIAKCLVELQRLFIQNCPTLEVVIRNESTVDDRVIIKFPKLELLTLGNLDSFQRFYRDDRGIDAASSIPAASDCLFDGKVEFPASITLTIINLEISKIWGKNCYNNNSFSQLERVDTWRCDNLEFVFPLAMLGTFQNLKALDIEGCDSIRCEVESRSSSGETSNAQLQQLLALRSILFYSCHSLGNLFLPSTAKDLSTLRKWM